MIERKFSIAMSGPDTIPEIPNALPASEPPVADASESSPTVLLTSNTETAVSDVVLPAPSTKTDYDFQPLAANWLRMERRSWHILIAIVGPVLGLGWLVLGLFIRQSFDAWQWLLLVPIGLLIAMLIWAAYFFPHRGFQATSWRLHPHGFEIRRGIWWRHRIFIPKDRIQHTDVHQGPIQRAYGLASLVLNTGGTHEPSITLEGLDMPLAESLREQLSKREAIQVPAVTKEEAVA